MEIHFALEAALTYRAWHGAAVEKLRVEMNEAMADLFEEVDIVLRATSPVRGRRADAYNLGEVSVSLYNAGAPTIPGNLSGLPRSRFRRGCTAMATG